MLIIVMNLSRFLSAKDKQTVDKIYEYFFLLTSGMGTGKEKKSWSEDIRRLLRGVKPKKIQYFPPWKSNFRAFWPIDC